MSEWSGQPLLAADSTTPLNNNSADPLPSFSTLSLHSEDQSSAALTTPQDVPSHNQSHYPQPHNEPPPVYSQAPQHADPSPSLPTTTGNTKPLRFCPAPSGYTINFEKSWYGIPSIPNFDVCSKCHADYIASSPFSGAFTVTAPSENLRGCDFNTPHVKSLWNEAIQTRSMVSLQRYIEMRSKIPACAGNQGIQVPSTTMWFVVRAGIDPVEGLFVCGACYHDHVAHTPFASCFTPTPREPAPTDRRACSFAMPYLRALAGDADTQKRGWPSFVENARARMGLPPCAGQAGTTKLLAWFSPTAYDVPGMVVCPACYLDHIVPSPHITDFGRCKIEQKENALWTCDLSNLPLLFAYGQKLDPTTMTRTIVSEAAVKVFKYPCTAQGVSSEEWHTLRSGADGFRVCPGCFAGFIRPLQMDNYFLRESNTKLGPTRICDLHRPSPRIANYINTLIAAYGTGDFDGTFGAYAQSRAGVPVCAKGEMVKDGVWFGTESFLACPECYTDFIKYVDLSFF